MKIAPNKYAVKVIKPTICPPVVETVIEEATDPKPRSAALIKAQERYYQKNKAMITQKQMVYNMKYTKLTKTCECGDLVSNSAKYKHITSKRHRRRMENINSGKPAGCTPGEVIVDCPCGGHYRYKQRWQHFRTKKHHQYEAEKQDPLKTQLSQYELKQQLRRMLLGEDLDPDDNSNNVNSSEIKEL
tara:strand:- start:849 stop:1409 length:561 start_codon:yes stop_codon:yes gene_type:complete